MKKKEKKGKKKFIIHTSEYGVILLLNFMVDSIAQIKEDISASVNQNELKDLIPQKYELMKIAKQLGIPIYDEELSSKKSLDVELNQTLKKNLKNLVQDKPKEDGSLNKEEFHNTNEVITPTSDDEVF